MPAIPRDIGDYMIASLKQLAGLDYRERRARQVGNFSAEYMREKHKCRITCQGIPTGERVALEVSRKKPPLENLEDIGMRPGMRKALLQALNGDGGMVLFSALPGDGLSTTWRAALQSTDRFLRDYFMLQEKSRQEPEIINVSNETWDESAGQTMHTALRSLLLREPHAIAFTEFGDAAAINEMCRLAHEKDIAITARLPGRHAVDAVVRAIMLKPDVGQFASALKLVVCQRVLRKLCPDCRQPFQASPALLAQLGLPADRIPVLYRQYQPRPEEMVDTRGNPVDIPPCESCGGLGFRERTGIFELLHVDERFRQVMKTTPTVAALTEAATRSGHVGLRDEGIVVIARGDTSLEELQRVLKK
jgi:type II secretory ATPase GspE/PulE/Tfp pilus assembly ATPase PilB-like protein